MTMRKNNTSYSIKKIKNTKEIYRDGKVGFVIVIVDNTRRGALPEEAFIHTAKITATKIILKEIHKRKVV